MNRVTGPVNFNNKLPAGLGPLPWCTHIAPNGWIFCYGQAISRTIYSALFSAIVPFIGNPTISNASPAVISFTAHGLSIGDQIFFTTTGALPTGISANTLYYIISAGFGANSFEISATYGGSAINTSSAGSGTHSLFFCPFGLGDGSTTFNAPDLRGRIPLGKDNLGGSASRVTANQGSNIGQSSGEESHTLTVAETPSHNHITKEHGSTAANSSNFVCGSSTLSGSNDGPTSTLSLTGGGSSHNVMSPYQTFSYIIKT